MEKRWHVLNQQEKKVRLDPETVVAVLLENRKVDDPDSFFNPPKPQSIVSSFQEFLPDLNEKDLAQAVKRIKKAVAKGEKIVVWGDYDVDGVSSTAILWQTLFDLGADAMPYIPNRFSEGYGLSRQGIEKLKGEGVSIIVTVDSGITAVEEVDFANSLGVDVVITDHHLKPKKLPKAHSIVHSTQVCGAGVSWIVASQLGGSRRKLREALDLVSIATVADLQPLTGVNRSLVRWGFEVLNRLKRPGLAALAEVSRLKPGTIGSYAAGWVLGPRINAVGRAGEIPGGLELNLEALRLLCTNNLIKARELAHVLGAANLERKSLTESVSESARSKVGEQGLIVVYEEGWHEGVIGLVASRLVEEYGRPAVVIAKGEEFSKGSARSVNGLNIVDVLRSHEGVLEDVGGHAAAAGFTVKNEHLDGLVDALRQGTRKLLSTLDLRPVLKVDLELPLENLSFDLGFELERFRPYGVGNPEPLFVARDVDVLSSREVGRDKRHLKLNLAPGFEAIWFGGAKNGSLASGDMVALVYTPGIERWKGKDKVVLKIRDLKRV